MRANTVLSPLTPVIHIWGFVDYYSPDMLGLKTDQEVLGELVRAKAPAVGQLMAQYPGIWTLVVSRWFICLYIDILPIEVRKGWGGMADAERRALGRRLTRVLLVLRTCRRS